MSYRLSLFIVVSAALFLSPPLFAAKGGGGHGGGHGGGGHGGGHSGGHSGVGSSSGHSVGHSPGHSIGHIFGHRLGEHGTRIGKKPGGSVGNPVRFGLVGFMHHRARRRMFHANLLFGSGYCTSFRFSWRNFLFPDEFDCFNDAFLFDPFLYGRSMNTYFWSDSLMSSGDSEDLAGPPETVENNLTGSAETPRTAIPLPSNVEEPVALLQLLDGSMYGLTRYWLEGTTLHYVTNYGGENTVPLVRIDFAKTIELNAAHGTRFDLTRSGAPR